MARSPFLNGIVGHNIPKNVFTRGKYIVHSGSCKHFVDIGEVALGETGMCMWDAYAYASKPYGSVELMTYERLNSEYFLIYPDGANSPRNAVAGGIVNQAGVVLTAFWRDRDLKALSMRVASELGATDVLEYLARRVGVYKTLPLVVPEPVIEKPISVWNEAYPTEW